MSVIEVEHGKLLGALLDGYALLRDDIKELKPLIPVLRNIATGQYIF